MTTFEPTWLALLRAEAERTSITAVAIRLHYSRTAISLVLAGKYLGATGRIEKAVIRVLEQSFPCPYLGIAITPEQCRSYADGRAPTHNPLAMQHWRACQQCPNNPQEK